jgi:hypothetical protein
MGAIEHIAVAMLNTYCVVMLMEERKGFFRGFGILINFLCAVANGVFAYRYMVAA